MIDFNSVYNLRKKNKSFEFIVKLFVRNIQIY